MPVSVINVQNLIECARLRAGDDGSLRALLPNPDMDLSEPLGTVSEELYLNLWEELVAKVEDPQLGLNIGCHLNINALGFIYEISLQTSGIEQALSILKYYLDNSFSLCEMEVVKSKEDFGIRISVKKARKEITRHIADMVGAFAYRELVLMLPSGYEPVLYVPEDSVEPFGLMLGATVKPGHSAGVKLELPISALSEEINPRKLKQVEVLLPQLLRLLSREKSHYDSFAMRVRSMTLSMCSPALPSLEQVLAQFPMSKRTFQRKLQKSRVSFLSISNEIKRELYHFLQIDHNYSTTEIAYLLGYSEPSALIHARDKWNS